MCDGNTGRVAPVRERWRRFRDWRRRRPFAGGVLLVLSGVLTAFLPAAYGDVLIIATGSFTGPALLLGFLLCLCGVGVLVAPSLSPIGGGLGILLATLSIPGALAGFVVGAVLGGIGGVLAFAWTPPADADGDSGDGAAERIAGTREEVTATDSGEKGT